MTNKSVFQNGILYPTVARDHFSIERYPIPALEGIIQHVWIVRWKLEKGQTYVSKTLNYPGANIVITHQGCFVGGVSKDVFSYTLKDKGVICGILFTPAGLSTLTDMPMKNLVDVSLSLDNVLPTASHLPLDTINKCDDDIVTDVEQWITDMRPVMNSQVQHVNDIMETIRKDRDIQKVTDICSHFAIAERTLQTLLNRYVGVGPKWILARYRMQDAASMINDYPKKTLSAIAHELGYTDQAHFSHDFKRIIGRTPGEYAKDQNGVHVPE